MNIITGFIYIGFAKFHRELLGTVLLLFIIITRSSISISKFR